MTFLEGCKLIIDGLWQAMLIEINFGDGIIIPIWTITAFAGVLGLLTKWIFAKEEK